MIHFFKILNYETPNYINDIVNNYNNHDTGYALRNENLRYPIPSTTSFKNSFFPSTIDLWNNLDDTLANCTSLYSFKRELKKRVKKPPKHYSYGDRKGNILLCQLRNSKSQLNRDLFDDHLHNTPNCVTYSPETVDHFLLHCPNYLPERITLMNTLSSNPELDSKMSISSNDQIKGNKDLSYEESCMLSDYVMEFIKQSKRL